jgi:hypothetical protein
LDDGIQSNDPIYLPAVTTSRAWTKEEDLTLIQARQTFVHVSDGDTGSIAPPTWSDVARHVPGRGAKACANRWRKINRAETATAPLGSGLTDQLRRSAGRPTTTTTSGSRSRLGAKHGRWWTRIKHAEPSGPPRMTHSAGEQVNGVFKANNAPPDQSGRYSSLFVPGLNVV